MLLKILRGFGWKDELVRERVQDYNYAAPYAFCPMHLRCILHDGIVTVRMCYSVFFSVNNAVVLLGTELRQQTLQRWQNKDDSEIKTKIFTAWQPEITACVRLRGSLEYISSLGIFIL